MSYSRLNQLGNIYSAINTLRRYNKYLLFSIDEKFFENKFIVEYFETPLDDEIETKVETILSVAAIMTVRSNPNIPEDKKQHVALMNARYLRETMRYAKLEYHATVKGIVTVQEYNRRKRAIPLVQIVAKLSEAKKCALTVLSLIRIISGYKCFAVIYTTSKLLWEILPIEVRKSLIMNSKEICDNALGTLHNYYEEMKSTEVGRAIGYVVLKTETKIKLQIQRLWEKAQYELQQTGSPQDKSPQDKLPQDKLPQDKDETNTQLLS